MWQSLKRKETDKTGVIFEKKTSAYLKDSGINNIKKLRRARFSFSSKIILFLSRKGWLKSKR